MKKTYDLPKDLIEEIEAYKERTGVSYNRLVARAVRRELQRESEREKTE